MATSTTTSMYNKQTVKGHTAEIVFAYGLFIFNYLII